MHDDATAGVPQETGALIDHILTKYHQMHRADLASLMELTRSLASTWSACTLQRVLVWPTT